MNINESVYTVFRHWIDERERVRLRKEAGDAQPWTTDPIIAEWRFCNVNRCDDRETKWIFKHIVEAHSASPVLWFNLCIARFVNWSPTLACIGYFDEWDRDLFVQEVEALQKVKEKVYTGAYMVPAGPAGTLKHVYLADAVFAKLWSLREQAPQNGACADWDRFLRQAPLMGDFLRNQVITDLRYTHHLRREMTPDWETFVLPGPGTQRGLNRLHGALLTKSWTATEASTALQALRARVVAEAPQYVETLRDINNLSNCMCELDKYLRVLNGEGKPRARYSPRSG